MFGTKKLQRRNLLARHKARRFSPTVGTKENPLCLCVLCVPATLSMASAAPRDHTTVTRGMEGRRCGKSSVSAHTKASMRSGDGPVPP